MAFQKILVMPKNKLFQWTRTQRNGVLMLIVLIILGQLAYFFIDFSPKTNFSLEQLTDFQQKIDSLKAQQLQKEKQIFMFNPNFLTDYRAYQLGISAEELQRLTNFRSEGKFVNSATEFQQVTQISDSLLQEIAPLFKFPEWVNQKKNIPKKEFVNYSKSVDKFIKKADINTATSDDLKKIYGIGDKLSERIVKYRERLQGFSLKEQIDEIYGLDKEVIARIWEQYDIISIPKIVKIDINFASKSELSKIPYISYSEAEEIILLRSKVGYIKDLAELSQIKSFDEVKIKKIELYLSAQNESK